ncbi:hypothetical protein CLOM_g8039 [Closterium sp. NIES-68]|nr:hypothetical protein CLOM_g8039 [Closterium sp. NIES-68]
MALPSSSSSSLTNGKFDPSAYAALRKEQFARAKELREARSGMMGDNNPRITFGPSMASQASPALTRSLSSSDLTRRRHSDVPPRHQSPQPKQRTPHYALPLNHVSSCSHRNSLGGTSGPLNSTGSSVGGGGGFGSASGPMKSQKGAFGGTLRSGHAEASVGGAGGKRRPHARKEAHGSGANGVKSISALNDASKFTDEELAAFSAAGAAAESLLAEENGIGAPQGQTQEKDENGHTASSATGEEEVVKEVTPTAQETTAEAAAAAAAAAAAEEEILGGTARPEAAGQSAGDLRRRESAGGSSSKGSKGLLSRSFRASLRLLRRALPSNGSSSGVGETEGGEANGADGGKKAAEQRRGELDDVNGNEGARGKKSGGSESEKGSQGAWMEVLRVPNSSSNGGSSSHGGAGSRKDKENVQRLAV